MDVNEKALNAAALGAPDEIDDGPQVGLLDLLTWIGQAKWGIASFTLLAGLVALGIALWLAPIYTARTTLLPPASQQQGNSAAVLAALGTLGNLTGSASAKTPDELYVALLRSETLVRALDDRFNLRARYKAPNFVVLLRNLPNKVRVSSDKKSGLVMVEVDDEEPKFAAELANAHSVEISHLLSRLAVSEAQLRRRFFEQQLDDTKEQLIKAELDLQRVQEKSGVIVLDKQAEALIIGAAQIRAQIAEREVQLKVLRTSATERNPDVLRLSSELAALRAELQRMESRQAGAAGSAVDMPVGKIPSVAVDYVRARREVKLQETLLESMLRQLEIAKLDEAKEGPVLQQVDVAVPPDYKSKPSRALIVLGGTLGGFVLAALWVVARRWQALAGAADPSRAAAWHALRRAWSPRG